MIASSMHQQSGSPALAERRAAVEALYAMGHSLFGQERFADAAAIFRILLQVAPEEERSWLALGECHERAGHQQIALELFGGGTIAAQPAPRCALARFRVLYDLDRSTEADEAFEKARAWAEDADDDELLALLEQERRVRS